jgi:hypothetical protein
LKSRASPLHLTEARRHSRTTSSSKVCYGSKCEILAKSRCFPLLLQQRTCRCAAITDAMCQFRKWDRHYLIASAAHPSCPGFFRGCSLTHNRQRSGSLFRAFAWARRSEGSERGCLPNAKSRGGFLSEFILAKTAPGERFSFLAMRPTLTRDIISSRNRASSAGVQGRPAGHGPVIYEIPHFRGLSNRNERVAARCGETRTLNRCVQLLVASC